MVDSRALSAVAALEGPRNRELCEAVFGTADPDAIALAIEGFCAANLGADPVACLFWESELGFTIGLEMDDGAPVVVRCQPPGVGREHLSSVAAVRRHLSQTRFPLPELLAGPNTLGRGFATAEVLVKPPAAIDVQAPDRRSLLARGLARLTAAAAQAPDAAGLANFHPDSGGLESNDLLDELMDLAAARMEDVEAGGSRVVTHLDWCADHVRIDGGAIRMVLGWSALYAASEPVAIGWVSARYLGSVPGPDGARRFPSPDDADAFIAAYATLRKTPWTEPERRLLGAARTTSLVDAARRELTGGGARSAEEMLQRFGERYLVVRAG